MNKPLPAPIMSSEVDQNTVEFFGLDFNIIDENMAVYQIRQLEKQSGYFYVVTPNVDHIVQLDKSTDSSLIEAYQGADMIICDSRILSFLAKRSGINLDAVPGSDLTRELLRTGRKNWRVAMIGGGSLLHKKLQTLYPDYEWVFHEPPMGIRRNLAARITIAEFIEDKKADMVFFAIGAPQSEITCREIALRGKATGVALCIGASLEFLTGAKRRAPRWMQRTGLEWLYRLGSEPRRLWRRYLVEGPKIFPIWWRWKKLKRK
ncbi:WecB/TagA/CpsF family glycosyltransferase [uncultured Parasphingorhabdus sp.]|uniref:WecB/TagA/CpsF family glycosyltransferase n=1 Tax=uncultured Parasphingorhabdus sp. TaxID=2709694 RepID=UPI0030D9BD06|tara:strand:- start:81468 stop:82253 length:786 start_codon:yes stop_codon:yes gene_type:complete